MSSQSWRSGNQPSLPSEHGTACSRGGRAGLEANLCLTRPRLYAEFVGTDFLGFFPVSLTPWPLSVFFFWLSAVMTTLRVNNESLKAEGVWASCWSLESGWVFSLQLSCSALFSFYFLWFHFIFEKKVMNSCFLIRWRFPSRRVWFLETWLQRLLKTSLSFPSCPLWSPLPCGHKNSSCFFFSYPPYC